VLIGPNPDPFLPVRDLQIEVARIVAVLGTRGVEAWLPTRGLITPAVVEMLHPFRAFVKITVDVTTLDRELQHALEPWSAAPAVRLRQLETLRQRGFAVHVGLEPLLPGVTDSRANLTPLFSALTAQGVRHVSAGYLSIRDGSEVRQALSPLRAEAVLAEYQDGPMRAGVRLLPRERRQRGYATLMALAAEHELTIGVSILSNPDFEAPRPPVETTRPKLLDLFLNRGRPVESV
jgi:DNA repair photolyase